MWNKLPKELLINFFVRLPMNDIIFWICYLNKSWRSSIISVGEFLQAFVDALVIQVALMVVDEVDGTVFFTQENKDVCFRYNIAGLEGRLWPSVVATSNGLVCIIEDGYASIYYSFNIGIRIFVMNIVTSACHELPPPSIIMIDIDYSTNIG